MDTARFQGFPALSTPWDRYQSLDDAREDLGHCIARYEQGQFRAWGGVRRGGPNIQKLLGKLLKDPPTRQSYFLPMGLYLTSIQVLTPASDPCVAKLTSRARKDLESLSLRMPGPPLRLSHLKIPDRQIIAAFKAGNPTP